MISIKVKKTSHCVCIYSLSRLLYTYVRQKTNIRQDRTKLFLFLRKHPIWRECESEEKEIGNPWKTNILRTIDKLTEWWYCSFSSIKLKLEIRQFKIFLRAYNYSFVCSLTICDRLTYTKHSWWKTNIISLWMKYMIRSAVLKIIKWASNTLYATKTMIHEHSSTLDNLSNI